MHEFHWYITIACAMSKIFVPIVCYDGNHKHERQVYKEEIGDQCIWLVHEE